jgi:hypothetical protein
MREGSLTLLDAQHLLPWRYRTPKAMALNELCQWRLTMTNSGDRPFALTPYAVMTSATGHPSARRADGVLNNVPFQFADADCHQVIEQRMWSQR